MTGGIHGHAKVGQTNANIEELHADLEEANATLGDISDTDELVLAKLTATGVTTSDIASNTVTANTHLAYLEVTGDGTNTRLTSTNTKLDTANGLLADIKTQGIAVNVNTDTLESLSTSGNTNTAGIRTDLATELTKLEQIRAAIAGTLSVSGSVSVSNFPATQAVSAVALPLPSGAATAANQSTVATGITQLHTDNGNEGSAPPALNGAGASGVLGYLRNQLDKLQTISTYLAGTLAVKRAAQQSYTGTIATPQAVVGTTIIDWTPVAGATALLQLSRTGAASDNNFQVLWSDDGTSTNATSTSLSRQATVPASAIAASTAFTAGASQGRNILQVTGAYFKVQTGAAFTGVGTITATVTFLESNMGIVYPQGTTAVDTELAAAASASDSYGNPNTAAVVSVEHGFNGTTWERIRTNNSAIVDTSSARTASGTGTTATNYNGRGGYFYINVTAVSGTTPTLTARVQTSADGTNWEDLDTTNAQTASITATGIYTLKVYPAITAVANKKCNDVLPRFVRLAWTIAGTTPSFTFVSGVTFIV